MPVWLKDHHGDVEKIDFANAFDLKDAGQGNIIVSAYLREPPQLPVSRMPEPSRSSDYFTGAPPAPRMKGEPKPYQIDFASFQWSGYTGVTNVEAVAQQWIDARNVQIQKREAERAKRLAEKGQQPELPLSEAPVIRAEEQWDGKVQGVLDRKTALADDTKAQDAIPAADDPRGRYVGLDSSETSIAG